MRYQGDNVILVAGFYIWKKKKSYSLSATAMDRKTNYVTRRR